MKRKTMISRPLIERYGRLPFASKEAQKAMETTRIVGAYKAFCAPYPINVVAYGGKKNA